MSGSISRADRETTDVGTVGSRSWSKLMPYADSGCIRTNRQAFSWHRLIAKD
jgi:hypothetical protein